MTWGVLIRLNCVPSSATSRQPRQNASRCDRAVARGPQRAPHQLRKDLPWQAQAPIGPRTVRQRFAEQLEQVVGQCPAVLHHVKGHRRQQLTHRDPRFASATAREDLVRHGVR